MTTNTLGNNGSNQDGEILSRISLRDDTLAEIAELVQALGWAEACGELVEVETNDPERVPLKRIYELAGDIETALEELGHLDQSES